MTAARLSSPGVALLLAALLSLSCGGGSSPSAVPLSGQVDLASARPLLSVTMPPGDVAAGNPHSITTGDFNGDGKTDLLIGAPLADGPGRSRSDAGEADVIYGPLSGDIDLSSRTPDVRILGALAGDGLGSAVAAGDLNGDGIDDIIAGAPFSNGLQNIRTDMGEVYVVFGGRQLAGVVDTAAVQQDFDLLSAEGFSHLGQALAVGDVNGDGIADLIAGAPYAGRQPNTPPGSARTTVGEVYVVYGSRTLKGQASVARDEENVRFSGVNPFDQFGDSVATADVNGDGRLDIIVGSSGYDGPSGDRMGAGGAFVFFGGSGLPAHKTLREADITITGADAGDAAGTLVAAADVNGDGKAEVILSSPLASGPDNKRPGTGEATIVDVAASGATVDLSNHANSARVFGPTSGEFLPSGMAATVMGGTPRLALGSDLHGAADRATAGSAYVVTPRTGQDVDLGSAEAAAATVLGGSAGDGLGAAVAFADLDGDGRPELLLLAAGDARATTPDPSHRARLYVLKLD